MDSANIPGMEPELVDSLPPLPRVSANMPTGIRHDALGQLYHRLAVLGGIYWAALDERDRDRYRAIQDWAWKESVESLRTCAAARPSLSHLGTMDARGEWTRSQVEQLFLDAGLKTPAPEPPLADQLLGVVRRAQERGVPAKDIRKALREATSRWSEGQRS